MAHSVKYFLVPETDSTNLEVARRVAALPEAERAGCDCFVASADFQTAGRGQRGNRWVAERGSNLLFSVLLYPEGVTAARQFVLSQAMSVAVCRAFCSLGSGFGVKWPNDIYYGDRKLCGTIIETTLRGGNVDRCILGVGINVNQETFGDEAPNPTSLRLVLGHEVDRTALLHSVVDGFLDTLRLVADGGADQVAAAYRSMLIRQEGAHSYRDAEGDFEASLLDVEPDGHLVLRDTQGRVRRYMFKEVRHLFGTLERE
jgi:BirA family transcriptional regulator, biotin operon repressor / biotin---[acetyl-CoA-carboxylase] ligase